MITRQVIETLYKKYSKAPSSPDCLDKALLFDYAAEHHSISFDMESDIDSLIIGSVDPSSPFHRIPLRRIHAIVPFEEWVAIVLHSSIIFLNRKDNKVSIDIRMTEPSLWEKVMGKFNR